jgi:hypothetical protein
MPYAVYTKLYDSLVQPVLSYSAAIWGFKTYTCIDAVQNRAMRFYLGTSKYTPTPAVIGDMGWIPASTRQWKCIASHWHRCIQWDKRDLRSKVFYWTLQNSKRTCKNWCYHVTIGLSVVGLEETIDTISDTNKDKWVCKVVKNCMWSYVKQWYTAINRSQSVRGNGQNKLRMYSKMKNEFETEEYCKMFIPRKHRSAFSKFRCGVAPIKIETGRYENIPLLNRVCQMCDSGMVESETHVLIECPLYTSVRIILFAEVNSLCTHFLYMSPEDKLVYLFSTPALIKIVAKTCYKILNIRKYFMFNISK